MPSQPPPHLAPYDRTNIFARILRGEAPCTRVYEDEFALAFDNIHPAAPVHVLVVPKGEYVSNADFSATAPDALVAGFWRAVAKTATALGLDESATWWTPPYEFKNWTNFQDKIAPFWQETLREKMTVTQFHQQGAKFLRGQG